MAEVKVEIDAVTDVKVEVEEIPNTIKPSVTVKVEADTPKQPILISQLAPYQPGRRRRPFQPKAHFRCRACSATFKSQSDLATHHQTHETRFEDTMERPTLNAQFRMASVLTHGPRKRQRPDVDDFDMVLGNEQNKVLTAKLRPILLEEISQEERIYMIQMPAKNEMDRVKKYFRERYPEYAGRWDHDDNWLECPVQGKTVARWRIRYNSQKGRMENTKTMVKRAVTAPPAELVAAKEEFRRVALELYKEKGMVLAREIKRRLTDYTNTKIYLRFRQIGWKSFNGMYSPPSWELNAESEKDEENEGATVSEIKSEIKSEIEELF